LGQGKRSNVRAKQPSPSIPKIIGKSLKKKKRTGQLGFEGSCAPSGNRQGLTKESARKKGLDVWEKLYRSAGCRKNIGSGSSSATGKGDTSRGEKGKTHQQKPPALVVNDRKKNDRRDSPSKKGREEVETRLREG